jgi:ABC-type polysaccharide/polyol phosphate export permease
MYSFRSPGGICVMTKRKAFLDRSLVQLTLVRFYEFMREPEAVFWSFVFPILLSGGLGLAFRSHAPDPVHVAVVRGTPEADRLESALKAKPGIIPELLEREAADRALRVGKVALVAVPGSNGALSYRYDETNPEGRTARLLADDAIQRAAGRTDSVQAADDRIREPGSRYIDFLLPGMLGMGLMGNGIWGIGFPIIDARRRKLLKRLIASPMSRAQYLLSFLIWRLIFLVVDVVFLLSFGRLVFGVPIRGRPIDLAVICLLAALAFSALGVLIASRAQTMQAANGLMNAVMVPMWILSGVFFSSSRFPDVMQPLVRALPLTATNEALRANMLEGTGLAPLYGQIAILSAWLVICFVCALRIFRWR